jgi:citrate lyase subunit beta-like protein
MRARRALLYTPGDDLYKIRKAITLGVDCICLDMEDGVALNRKAEARLTVVEALKSLDFGTSERLARINSIGSGLEEDDLAAVLPAHPDAVVVPKVEYGEQVNWVSKVIAGYEERYGWPIGSIPLLVGVETALGIVNLAQIASSTSPAGISSARTHTEVGSRLEAIIFGAEDFASDIGATRTHEGWELFYARSAVATYAAAFGLQAIDMVYIDFNDSEGLRREAIQGAQMAFAGKQIIHPNQVAPVQEAFTPSEEAIAQALRLMQAFEEHQQAGKGAFALDGKMIDAPIVKAAERVIVLARAAGKI